MLVMTAKVDKKKILIVTAVILAAVIGLFLIFGGNDSTPTASEGVANNDARVAFLKSFGWEVTTSPVESGQVRIPEAGNEVFNRYNELQKSQGYDLSAYAGKTVMRYVYLVNNYPNASAPVYATLLVYKNQVIGGDVTDTSAKGTIRSFKMPTAATPPATSAPSGTTPTT
ncbi:MAG: DUF4830 domain-containing protein [Ruminococcaceae bacterium]|nr:DUF4830 domain-containing protein [Oscillospiraceae bacterium]